MANVDQKNLIPLCILEVLKKYSDQQHPLTHNMIADHLVDDYNISPRPERKSIGRNLENLRTQMEFDIEITPKGSYLVSHDFEDYEIRLLIDSVLSNKYISVIETRELVDKLKNLSGVYFESYEDHLLTIDEKKKTDKRDLYLKLQMVNNAIKSGRDLRYELDEDADYPTWMVIRTVLEDMRTGKDSDADEEIDRSVQIKPEYLVLMNCRYYVAFKAIDEKTIAGPYYEELMYCGLDEMNNLRIVEHEPVILPYGESLANKLEVSEDAVREMVSRGVLEHREIKTMRVDFLIDPPFLKKIQKALGEPLLIKEYNGTVSQLRVIIDVDKDTFERFWWSNLTEIRLLGPQFEVTWLTHLLSAAKESMADAEWMRKTLAIEDVILDSNNHSKKSKSRKSGKIYPKKKILNERISSNEYETEVHVFGRGNEMKKFYNLSAELEIEDEGHIVFLRGIYDMHMRSVYLWTTTESLFSIEEENKDIYGELAKRCNRICEAGVNEYFPGTDPADRYSDMESHMLNVLRDRMKQDKWDDELSEDSISWECPYYDEDCTGPFDWDTEE